MKVLMVCLGNICRSPMAEGILREYARKKNLPIDVDSAGTSHFHVGEAPDRRAIQCMKSHGIDISNLRARQFSTDDFHAFDRIYAMDINNYHTLADMAKTDAHRQKLKLILSEIPNNMDFNVPDPYYGVMDDFEDVYQRLSHAMECLNFSSHH